MTKRFARLVEAVGFLSLASIVVGFFGRWHLLFDLASHFRLQATCSLLVCGLTLWWSLRKSAYVFLSCGTACAVLLWPYAHSDQASRPPQYRLLLINVLTHNPEKAKVVELIHTTAPDFVVLLETDSEWIAALDAELTGTWPHRKAVPRSDNSGIAFYSKLEFETCEVKRFTKGNGNPSISASFQLRGGPLRVIATHPPPPKNSRYFALRNELFDAMAKDVLENDPTMAIVAGDLNCTPWSPYFKKLCRESGLDNSMHGNGLGISWTPFRFRILGLPIDHVLTGSRITVVERYVGDLAGSDHRPVVVDFAVP